MGTVNIKTISKSQKVYNHIIQEIISGNIFPNQRLVERELIEKYNTSKTPVREALNKLAENNILKYELNKGYSVVRISHSDIEEMYDLREIFEGLVARKIAENTGELILKNNKIKKNIKLSERCLVNNNIQKYSILDMEFHQLLTEMSKNQRLKSMMDKLYCQSRLLLSTSLYLPGRGIDISLSEHKSILKAISNNDIVKSENEARNHIKNVKNEVLKWVSCKVDYNSF